MKLLILSAALVCLVGTLFHAARDLITRRIIWGFRMTDWVDQVVDR